MVENVKILLIEDNPGDIYPIEDHLEEYAHFSYELNYVVTLNEALAILKKQQFDIILLDLELPDSYGISTFFSIHNKYPLIPIIILTGMHDEKIKFNAMKMGAKEFLVKEQTEGRLLGCILRYSIKSKKGLFSVI
jgi:CheY-like chemotaxis protein